MTRTCRQCGKTFPLSDDELADGTYSPLCTDCLRERRESDTPHPPVPEEIIGENN